MCCYSIVRRYIDNVSDSQEQCKTYLNAKLIGGYSTFGFSSLLLATSDTENRVM